MVEPTKPCSVSPSAPKTLKSTYTPTESVWSSEGVVSVLILSHVHLLTISKVVIVRTISEPTVIYGQEAFGSFENNTGTVATGLVYWKHAFPALR